MGIFAAGIGEFLGRRPALLDARDHLAADRAVGIVLVDHVEEVRRDRHRQLRAGKQHARPLLIGEIHARLEIRERIDAVAELPFVIVPVRLGNFRPVAGGMGAEGGVEVAWGGHSRNVRCNRSGRIPEGSRGELWAGW